MGLGFPSTHVESDFTEESLGGHHVDAVDLCQIHSGDAQQFATQRELRHIPALFALVRLR